MSELLQVVLESEEKADLHQLLSQLRSQKEHYLLRNQILKTFADYCENHNKPAYFFHSSPLGELLHYTHELILEGESSWFLIRTNMAQQKIYRLKADLSSFETMTPQDLLQLHDRWVNRDSAGLLEIDMEPFYASSPKINDPRSIGQGLEFLNRYLSGKLFADSEKWLEALLKMLVELHYNNVPLLVNERIKSTLQLADRVQKALDLVSQLNPEEPYQEFRFKLQELGFEPGWGNNALRVKDTLELLKRLIDCPDHGVLEAFISRIPMVFRAVLASVHGWVAQEGVLGKAETAGIAVYVLEQAQALEAQLQEDMKLAGLDKFGVEPKVIVLTRLIPNCEGTSCHMPLEKIQGTNNAWILRVPFQSDNPQITDNWLSHWEIWPYLERFALDAEKVLVAEFKGQPDLIVGNYSDGNLVAYLLAKKLGAIHCNIGHVLEKTKYLFSNLYWQDMESQYHFSLQFTADLIAMNAADFILTSTHQEIVGTPDNLGYYESYKCFSMPELYHVVNGVELFSPKFNVVPPGINEQCFFPYSETDQRATGDQNRIKDLLFSKESSHIVGYLENPDKRPIFSLAPLLEVKNLSGLVECFAKSPELQEYANLIILTSHVHGDNDTNEEKRGEIAKIHQLIENYHLQGKIRWLGLRLTTPDLGEAYRVIADCGGIFIHPGRFESFGLTVLEGMISGLPTFATQFGGPAEIIQDGDNGFLINPTDLAGTAQKIQDFMSKCEYHPDYWYEMSQAGIKRVRDKYNWRVHTKHLLLLSKIYGFWNLPGESNRKALLNYLDALFYLIYRPRAEQLLAEHSQKH